MHQEVFQFDLPAGYGRSTRPRSGGSSSGSSGSGGGAAHAPAGAALGLAVLTSDPLLDLVYRSGMVTLRDLRALLCCTKSEAIRGVAQERARRHLSAAAGELRAMRGAFELCAARVRGVALDAEMRLLQLGVPMLTVHPELSSPLREGEASHHALYAGLTSLNTVLRAATHPAAWAEQPASIWDALATSAGISMRPQLVLMLSALLPVEARLSYLGLRHAAYAAPGVCDLGGLVKSVLLRMMLQPYGPQDLRRLTKQLKQVAPRMSPFSFWLLRQCAAGSGTASLTLAQQQAARAGAEKELGARIDRLFAEAQEQVLYSPRPWIEWLHRLPTTHLVAFYMKYLCDAFQ
ncbi:hypothetical protein C2E21_8558 [Chlorella sorokiniana]|uniref:Uncharacterized protein n=1 Tax=Chlorella sorokiniana TaxID=3076 RepID=A0A2P6TE13_CHLSO|nr:hypothetical protein C2E21_8558 [Chlorella sorokiniana]|eukprot:PRW20881.1 hypothetical protein C2E21_8558 [Chlorella sorokiniana]